MALNDNLKISEKTTTKMKMMKTQKEKEGPADEPKKNNGGNGGGGEIGAIGGVDSGGTGKKCQFQVQAAVLVETVARVE